MNRSNRIIVPTELEASIDTTIDVKLSGDDDASVRGGLDAASTGVASNGEEGNINIKRVLDAASTGVTSNGEEGNINARGVLDAASTGVASNKAEGNIADAPPKRDAKKDIINSTVLILQHTYC